MNTYNLDERDLRDLIHDIDSVRGWVIFLGVCQIIGIVWWVFIIILTIIGLSMQ